ncbi:MAG: sulfotransferase [Planctomycetota bacterium]
MNLHFLVPGFSKCGTTTLCSLLGEHPDIFIPAAKEPCFFAYNYELGWHWYERSFATARDDHRCGEGSTFYSTEEYADLVCERALDRFPDLQLIFIARHPIARLESSFREMHHSGYKYGVEADYAIGEALRSLPNMAADTMYWARLSTFRRHVPDERIHALFLEDLKKDPATEVERCFRFLGVDSTVRVGGDFRRLNPASAKLYDAPWFRSLQRHRWAGPLWRRSPAPLQAAATRWLRARRPFRGPIQWEPRDKQQLVEAVREDSRAFLRWADKPSDYWRFDDAPQRIADAA